MKTKRRFFTFLLPVLALAALPVAAQQGPVFAPFVSRLERKITDNRVALSWVDSRDVRGPVYVYRASEAFGTPELLAGITPAEIPYGTQAYADDTELSGPVYYFVVASDENGLRYDYPILNNNTIEVSASSGAAETVELLPGEGEDGLKRPRVFVRDLHAVPAADANTPAGEEHLLASIVRGPFVERNWYAAKRELASFLSLSPERETATRAKFYLGQCSYFLRQPEDGLYEFTAFQALYPAEASGWITASLEMIGGN